MNNELEKGFEKKTFLVKTKYPKFQKKLIAKKKLCFRGAPSARPHCSRQKQHTHQ